jgi:uncharacterized protein YkwD
VRQIFALLDRNEITAAEAADMLGANGQGNSASTIPSTATLQPTPPAPARTSRPSARYLDAKNYMLELINAERAKVGAPAVVLGDNIAAQLHAETSLENCSSSHWGVDGLKPYMRYSLASGYQSNAENGSGSDYCITVSDGYRANASIKQEIRETMAGWMRSQGHRENILDPWHKKVNIGLAWDRYNTVMYQHFEGDYVEYQNMPTIKLGVLEFSGRTKNGARLADASDLGVSIYYDPPPHVLTIGQLARTYCYDWGRKVASFREPLTVGWYYDSDEYTTTYELCPDPYRVPADAPAARSLDEAGRLWEEAYKVSQTIRRQGIVLPWVTASKWAAMDSDFAITADISQIISEHGPGVYSIIVLGVMDGEDVVISQYSLFHDIPAPNTYDPASP